MPRISHLVGPMVTAILVVAPIGNLAVWLLLLLAVEVGLALLLARRYARRAARAARIHSDDDAPVRLRRRTVPHLRARRPFGMVQEQVRWRQAAEAHRRRRGSGL